MKENCRRESAQQKSRYDRKFAPAHSEIGRAHVRTVTVCDLAIRSAEYSRSSRIAQSHTVTVRYHVYLSI